jgi:hypothetical protein
MMKTNGKTKTAMQPGSVTAWTASSHVVNMPANEAEYNELVAVLDYLLDTSDLDEQSPASALIDMIGTLIESYENANVPELSPPRRGTRPVRRAIPTRRLKTA